MSSRKVSTNQSSVAQLRAGIEMHKSGALDLAAERYLSVLDDKPSNFEALHLLGILRAQQSKLLAAKELLGRAIASKPDSAAALNNLGHVLNQLGEFSAAISVMRKAVELDANDPVANNNLGNAYQGVGDHSNAERSFRAAVSIRPHYPEALNNLGATLHKLDRDPEALTLLKRALALDPNFAPAYSNLGLVYAALNQAEEAKECLRKAISMSANHKSGWINLGDVHLSFGEPDEALNCFKEALGKDPTDGGVFHRLSNMKTFRSGDADIGRMEAVLAARRDRDDPDTIALRFALSKAYDDMGETERSFELLAQANRQMRGKMAYDEAATLKKFSLMAAEYTADRLEQFTGMGHPSPVPIFIVGMMRSGSTLVEQILASHPKIRALGELHEFSRLAESIALPEGRNLKNPGALKVLASEHLHQLGQRYVNAIALRAGQAERITDKHLGNSVFAGLIHLALPNARIIYTNRDPIDTCLSCYSKLFTAPHPYAYDLSELGRYWRAHRELMQHWTSVLPSHVFLEVQYETLVADFENQARRIIAHCALDWDPACLDFHEAKRFVATASLVQVRQPLYASAVGRQRPKPEFLNQLLGGLGQSTAAATEAPHPA